MYETEEVSQVVIGHFAQDPSLMKIFALYIKTSLTQKPEWFDEFLQKYFEPVDLHITLIQPRYIDEKQINDLQSLIIKTLGNIGEIDRKLIFDKLVIGKESDGKYIYSCLMLEKIIFLPICRKN